MVRRVVREILGLVLLSLGSLVQAAQPLDEVVDLSFGEQGMARVSFDLVANPQDWTYDMARASSGRLYVLTDVTLSQGGSTRSRIALSRFHADGRPDLAFSGDGVSIQPHPRSLVW